MRILDKPAPPTHGKFMTSDERAKRFGPTKQPQMNPPTNEPLIEEAVKSLRHQLEEELRALPLELLVQRVLAACSTGQNRIEITVAARRDGLAPGEPGYQVTATGNASPFSYSVHEAFVHIGVDKLEALEKQAAGLRESTEAVERQLREIRGPAR